MVWALPCSLATTWGIISYFLFLRVLRCFSSPGWLSFEWYLFKVPGCPIQKSTDQRLHAPTHSLSQLATSFFASQRQGIHHTPLFALKFFNLHQRAIFSFVFSIFTTCYRNMHWCTSLRLNCFPNMSKNFSFNLANQLILKEPGDERRTWTPCVQP